MRLTDCSCMGVGLRADIIHGPSLTYKITPRGCISPSTTLGRNNSWTIPLRRINRARHSTLISHHSDRQMWLALLHQLRQDDDLNEPTFSPARCLGLLAALRTISDHECLQVYSALGPVGQSNIGWLQRTRVVRAGSWIENNGTKLFGAP
jgi:hypothetical protein